VSKKENDANKKKLKKAGIKVNPSNGSHMGKKRKWDCIEAFTKWRNKHLKQRKDFLMERHTPLENYVMFGMGHERPFTGDHWWTKDVGIYSCKCCSQNLFMSDHKYESKSGYPTFWNHMLHSIDYKRDVLTRPHYSNAFEDPTLKNKTPIQRCFCSHCEAHMGFIYDDGPGPFFKRF
tara:strand:- start:1994 stop:2524 length:531 start_codon:yes stop_codon:yes gene_type:complete